MKLSPALPWKRAATVALAAAALLVLPATAASAHVGVTPDATTEGGRASLTFRVPTESETASTTRLVVDLPTDTPFLSVTPKVLAGWEVTVEEGELPEPVEIDGTKVTSAPLRVVWTAQPGGEIPPHQFQELVVRVNALPPAGTDVVLPAHQEYSDGSVVHWAEVAEEGAEEPEHPAPVFTTTAEEATESPEADVAEAAAGTGSDVDDDDAQAPVVPTVLAGAALVLAAFALFRRKAS